MSPRNPFRIRSFQRTSGDEQFVRLFAPSALDVLEGATDLWESLRYIRSAPGGGKTSLLRLMTPGPLRKIAGLAAREPKLKDIAARLQAIGALCGGQPAVLGVMLAFSNDYRDLSALDKRGLQVFRALFSARVVLAALRAVLEHADKMFPDDLKRVRAVWPATDGARIPGEADGEALKAWAAEIEDSAYEVLDSMRGEESEASRAMTGFDGLNWLALARFSVDGVAVDARTVLLIDEAQELASEQRTSLNEALTALRKPLGIWVAERLQAVRPNDLLAIGVKRGRDYAAEIRLEETWRGRNTAPLRRFLGEIADLRVDEAAGFEGRSFFPLLAGEIEDQTSRRKLAEHARALEEQVRAAEAGSERYAKWIEATRAEEGSELTRSVAWQVLMILMARDRDRKQASFDLDALPAESLQELATRALQEAAELMVCKAARVPYYFGPERVAQLSSANVDQFLVLGGDLFEEMVSERLLRKGTERGLAAERQQEILKAAGEMRWKEVPRGSARGHAVLRFLEGMAAMCGEETYRETSPYAPGVTGVGMTMSDRDFLISGRGGEAMDELREVLGSCVAQNLLEPRLDALNKGQQWMVLYFNRLLCLHHDLPLGYGGWRPQKLQTLARWVAGREAQLV
jgi:hypothetical protein